MSASAVARLPLLKAMKDLAKSGARLDASIVTTYAFNGLFYEEVLLRAFERAGSRLNVVLVDAAQLAESFADPLRRPVRAGADYLLAPVPHVGAFHPKIVALLSEKQPILALGSHNATDAGFTHNEELTAFWGAGDVPPPQVLRGAVEYAMHWLESHEGVRTPVLPELAARIRGLLPDAPAAANADMSFVGSLPGSALWDQVRAQTPGKVRRVYVVGPYFDSGMSFLRAIDEAFAPDEILVGIQPDTAVLPRPDLAPNSVRFVDAAALGAFWPKSDERGFVHGKALALETTDGLVVSLGSANPTGAAWLQQSIWNAEANLCLTGVGAARAFSTLGLDRLADAPTLEADAMAEVSARSQELRRQEQAEAPAPAPPVVVGAAVDGGVFLAAFQSGEMPSLILVDGHGRPRPVSLVATDGGSLISLADARLPGGLYQLQSADVVIAFVLLNDDQALRAAALPRESARILDHLGALDSTAGFTELLDLLDKHVLSTADAGASGASRPAGPATPAADAPDEEAPFGPRGISRPQEAEGTTHRPRLSDGLIADIISALIRALGAPAAPPTDGDAPDLDEGDTEDEPTSDQLARNLEAEAVPQDIDWPRLVTACRKRLTVMLRKLEARLLEAAAGGHDVGWALGRLVVVLSLLQRLRAHPPQTAGAISRRARPTSLVSVEQLRAAFGTAICALYGAGKLAEKLEAAPSTRAAEERRLVDNLLLWFAREIGADYQRPGREKADPAMLQARADLGPVVMSAAAYPELEAWARFRDPWLTVWDDAVAVPPDWTERHLAYGAALQSQQPSEWPLSKGAAQAGDVVQWSGERGLAWVVASVSGDKATLVEPAGARGREKKVLLKFVSALDLDRFAVSPLQRAS